MEFNSETVIYLKDSAFIPEYADLDTGSGTVVFYNSDTISHCIQCRGMDDLSEVVISPGKFVELSFPSPGRFEFSSSVYGLMKCIIEVEDISETFSEAPYSAEWGELTYHLSKPRLTTKSSLTELLSTGSMGGLASEMRAIDGHIGDAKALLNKQRMLWTQNLQQYYSSDGLSKSGRIPGRCTSDSNSSDEGGEFTYQRQRIRNKARILESERLQQCVSGIGVTDTLSGPSTHSEDSDSFDEEDSVVGQAVADSEVPCSNNPGEQAPATVSGSSFLKSPSRQLQHRSRSRASESLRTQQSPCFPPCTSYALERFRAMVDIRDYDFDRRNIIVPAGAPVEFRLQDDVPLHVEHVLEGRSVCPELCFTSPILQLPLSRRYEVLPSAPGEIFVSCQIYPDMACRIVVMPTPPLGRAAHSILPRISANSRKKSTAIPSPLRVGSASSSTALSRLNGSFPMAQRQGRQAGGESLLSPSGGVVSVPPFSPKGHWQHPSQQSMLTQGMLGLAEAVWLGRSTSVSSMGELSDTLSSSVMDSDDGPDDYYNDMLLSHPLSNQASQSIYGREDVEDLGLDPPPFYGNSKQDFNSSPCGHFDELDKPDFTVYVEDFKFQPSQMDIPIGSSVKFQSVSHASMHKLTCVGAFDAATLECSEASSFTFCFEELGNFSVKNEIFSFMECEISVVPDEESCGSALGESYTDDYCDKPPTLIWPIGHSEYDPKSGVVGLSDDVRKYYDHIDGAAGGSNDETRNCVLNHTVHQAPLTLRGSFVSDYKCICSPMTGTNAAPSAQASLTKVEQQFLLASVDWGLTIEDLSDEDVLTDDAERAVPDHNSGIEPEAAGIDSGDDAGSGTSAKKRKKKKKKSKKVKVAVVADDPDDIVTRVEVARDTLREKSSLEMENIPDSLPFPVHEASGAVGDVAKAELSVPASSVIGAGDTAADACKEIEKLDNKRATVVRSVCVDETISVKQEVNLDAKILDPPEAHVTKGKDKRKASSRTEPLVKKLINESIAPSLQTDSEEISPCDKKAKTDREVAITTGAVGITLPLPSKKKKKRASRKTSSGLTVSVRTRTPGEGKVTLIENDDMISPDEIGGGRDVSTIVADSSIAYPPSEFKVPPESDNVQPVAADPVNVQTSLSRNCTPPLLTAKTPTSDSGVPVFAVSLQSSIRTSTTDTQSAKSKHESFFPTPPSLGRESAFTPPEGVKPNNLYNMLHSAAAALRSKEAARIDTGAPNSATAKHRCTSETIMGLVTDTENPILGRSPGNHAAVKAGNKMRTGTGGKASIGTTEKLLSEKQLEIEKDMEDFFCDRWRELCIKRSEGIKDVLPYGMGRSVVRIRSNLVKNSMKKK